RTLVEKSMIRHIQFMLAFLTAAVASLVLHDARAQDGKNGDGKNPLIGKPAADVQGDFAVNGKPVRLSELKGKVVLLDFWAVWCLPCIEALPQLEKLHGTYKADGLEILAVTYYNFDRGIHLGFDKKTGKLKTLESSDQAGEQAMLKDFVEYHN